jgi:hypothetical protein
MEGKLAWISSPALNFGGLDDRSSSRLSAFFTDLKISMKKKISIPFDFVLEQLYSVNIEIRPMFGCFALYVHNKIVLILRKRDTSATDNGVWLATSKEHHGTLKRIFPSMRSIKVLGGKESNWQNLPADAGDFEEMVIKACEMILHGDNRIGRETRNKTGKKVAKKRSIN